MKPLNVFFSLLFLVTFSQAQELLRLEDAIQLALENNYGIKVAKNNHRINQNNAHPGNAGLLPTLSATAGINYNNDNTTVDLRGEDGGFTEVKVTGLETSSNNGAIGISYTLFDGLGNVNTFRVLKTTVLQSEEQTRSIIELSLAQVIDTYYQLARLQGNHRILAEQISISRERVQRLRNQAEFGATNRLAVLNAEVDLNTDSVSIATSLLNLGNAQRNLNALMGVDIARTYELPDEIEFMNEFQLAQIAAQAMQHNADLQVAKYNQQIAALNLKVAKAARMPVIALNASYGFVNQDNGFISFARTVNNIGFSGGASLNVNLFNGNRTQINIQNAQIRVHNTIEQYDELRLQLGRDLSNMIETYKNSLKILQLEQKSLEAANLNFQRTQDAFLLGQANNTQFREAQLNVLRVKNQLNDLRYDTKIYEKDLLRLSGGLKYEN